jgi:hypothetical protein
MLCDQFFHTLQYSIVSPPPLSPKDSPYMETADVNITCSRGL